MPTLHWNAKFLTLTDPLPSGATDKFLALATQCAAAAPGGVVEALEIGLDPSDWSQESVADEEACSRLDVVEEAAMGSRGVRNRVMQWQD